MILIQNDSNINFFYVFSARKTNVKALKACIWKELTKESETPSSTTKDAKPGSEKKQKPANIEDDVRVGGDAKVTQTISFHDIVHALPQSSMAEQIGDTSTALSLLAVLHLANEKGLRLYQEGTDDGKLSSLIIRGGDDSSESDDSDEE